MLKVFIENKEKFVTTIKVLVFFSVKFLLEEKNHVGTVLNNYFLNLTFLFDYQTFSDNNIYLYFTDKQVLILVLNSSCYY